jgi:predicted metal-dependent phosphoesterase TrpH
MALDRHLSALSITDHDTVAGVGDALSASQGTSLVVIPGVEIGSVIESREVHLLGYYIDPESSRLRETIAVFRASRLERAKKIISKLGQLGIVLSSEWVRLAQSEDRAIGRPHIARALVDEGFVSTLEEAFDRYLGLGAPAYVPRYRLPSREVLELIREAGGIPVMAHPLYTTEFLPQLVDEGLEGLETFYRGYTSGQTSELLSLAHRYHLVPTGGSDFHGRDRSDAVSLGGVYVPPDAVEKLRARLDR